MTTCFTPMKSAAARCSSARFFASSAGVKERSAVPAAPLVHSTYVTSQLRAIHLATTPPDPISASSGWAKMTMALSGTSVTISSFRSLSDRTPGFYRTDPAWQRFADALAQEPPSFRRTRDRQDDGAAAPRRRRVRGLDVDPSARQLFRHAGDGARLVAEPHHEGRLFLGPQLRCSERSLGAPWIVHEDPELATAAPVAGRQRGDVDARVGER